MAYRQSKFLTTGNKELSKFMDPVFYGLHDLFRDCTKPLNLVDSALELLKRGANVNGVDNHGDTPLSLLVLHVNRGLKYHRHKINEHKFLEDDTVSEKEKYDICVDVDARYQSQVQSCLEMLLCRGTITNVVPNTCPSVIHQVEWNELFELKLIQSELRWTILSFGPSMEFATYNVFNPLSSKREKNMRGINIFHLMAWRGDAHCLRLLLHYCAIDANLCTVDGWNALHFLFFYCNKPSDLIVATKLLIDAGVRVSQTDRRGITPMHLLLCHVLVKRSHMKYLANAYHHDYVIKHNAPDNYCNEIKQCLVLLFENGATANFQVGCIAETPLHFIFERFERSLVNCQEEFQAKGHLLVPYAFQLKPMLEFIQYFVQLPEFKINATNGRGQTSLHVLASSLRNLSLDEELNPTDVLVTVFVALLQAGADPNLMDLNQRTVGHIMVEVASSRRGGPQRYLPVIQTLLDFGADFSQVNRCGNSVLHVAVSGSLKQLERLEFVLFLLRCGADPSTSNEAMETPLCRLLQEHVFHHQDIVSPSDQINVFLLTVEMLCRTMTLRSFNRVTFKYFCSGFCGVFCQSGCQVHQLLWRYHSTPRSLSELCRVAIWRSMRRKFFKHCQTDLSLPKKLSNYVYELVS